MTYSLTANGFAAARPRISLIVYTGTPTGKCPLSHLGYILILCNIVDFFRRPHIRTVSSFLFEILPSCVQTLLVHFVFRPFSITHSWLTSLISSWYLRGPTPKKFLSMDQFSWNLVYSYVKFDGKTVLSTWFFRFGA